MSFKEFWLRMENKICSDAEAAQFSLRLQQLLDAGIPLLRALSILQSTWNKSQAGRYRQLEKHLDLGKPLSSSLKIVGYPPFFCTLIAFSEQHGQLVETLGLTYQYYYKRSMRKQQLHKMFTYPIMVLCSSVFTMLLIIFYLFPQFASLYLTLGISPPLVIRLSLQSQHHGQGIGLYGYISVILLLVMMLSYYFFRFKRAKLADYLIRLPHLSKLIKLHVNGFISTQLGLLLEGGIPILEICRLFHEEGHSELIRNIFRKIDVELREGHSLSATLGQIHWFLPILTQMVAVGEQSGMLGPTLKRAGEQLDQDLDYLLTRTAGYVENLLLMGTGVVVLLMLYSLFSPMLSIVNQL